MLIPHKQLLHGSLGKKGEGWSWHLPEEGGGVQRGAVRVFRKTDVIRTHTSTNIIERLGETNT